MARSYGFRLGIVIFLSLASGLSCLLAARFSGKKRKKAFYSACLFIFSILGMLTFSLQQSPGVLAGFINEEVRVSGRISNHPGVYAGYCFFDLKAVKLESGGSVYRIEENIQVRAPDGVRAYRDDTVAVSGQVRSGRVLASCVVAAEGSGFLNHAYTLRKRVYACLKDTYNKHLGRDLGPVCEALVLGNRTDIPYGILSDFRGAGIYHVLAISGMHISILVYLMMKLLKKTPGWLALVIVLPILGGFNLMVGLRASLLRASSMMVLMMLGRSWGRKFNTGDVFFITFAVLLLFIPSFLADLGFWLSFVCFGSIIFIVPLFERLLGWPRNYYLRLVTVSATIGLATFPLNAYFFGMFSMAGVFSNLIILPVFYVFMIMLFIISFLVVLWPPSGVLLVLLRPFLTYITRAAHYINRVELVKIEFDNFPLQAVLIYYVLLFLLLLLLYKYIILRDARGQK